MILYKKPKVFESTVSPLSKTRKGTPIFKQTFHMDNGISIYVTIVSQTDLFTIKHLTQIGIDLLQHLRHKVGMYVKLWNMDL